MLLKVGVIFHVFLKVVTDLVSNGIEAIKNGFYAFFHEFCFAYDFLTEFIDLCLPSEILGVVVSDLLPSI